MLKIKKLGKTIKEDLFWSQDNNNDLNIEYEVLVAK